jgi:cell division protein FtsI (penicillin-binding protein 3)
MAAIPRNADRPNNTQETIRRRLPWVIAAMVVFGGYLVIRAASFQYLSPAELEYIDSLRAANYGGIERIASDRGRIFDRDGQPLAVNVIQYEIGLSANLISNPRRTATQLAAILIPAGFAELTEVRIAELIATRQPWVLLARPVAADVGQRIADLDILGVRINPIPRRSYPQGILAAQVVGFVAGDGDNRSGYYGVEGYYEDQLAGRIRAQEISDLPFDVPDTSELERGKDLVLTIDREVQFIAETELQRAIDSTGASGGTIIIMNPRNGDILAMASSPSFDPNAYGNADQNQLDNPAVSAQYEPGSVMKPITVAAALDNGTIPADWTYVDQASIEVGGVVIENWDRRAHGAVDVSQVLIQSLNVGAATLSIDMGPTSFYQAMQKFGFGQATGVDLQGEVNGTLKLPGDSNWSESDLGTNSFGQGIAATPLQMLTAINAIANDGLMYQPRIVLQVIDGGTIINAQPTTLGRPISQATADLVTQMMVRTVNEGVDQAILPGYSIAGKSGTAEIPVPGFAYRSDAWIMSFVGFFPADDPQVSILIKLDEPTSGRWASQVAAPVFQRLAERLVIQLEIPNDETRRLLADAGGTVSGISR